MEKLKKLLPVAILFSAAFAWAQYSAIKDESSVLPRQRTLQMYGHGVSCADGTNQTSCFVEGFDGGAFSCTALSCTGITLTNSGATSKILSNISAATATTTVPALWIAPIATLDAQDLVLRIMSKDTSGSEIFALDVDGRLFMGSPRSRQTNPHFLMSPTDTASGFSFISFNNSSAVTMGEITNIFTGANSGSMYFDYETVTSGTGADAAFILRRQRAGASSTYVMVGNKTGRVGFGNYSAAAGQIPAKVAIKGEGTGTGPLFLLEGSGGADQLTVQDNGVAVFSNTVQASSLGAGAAPGGFGLNVAVSNAANNLIQIQNTSSTGYVSIVGYDSSTNHKFTLGYGNASSNAAYAGTFFIYTQTGVPIVFHTGNTPRHKMDSDGQFYEAMGSTSNAASIGGTVNVCSGTVGNVGTGEDTLCSYTLPASSITATGRGIKYESWGTIANNGNAKTLKIYFGVSMITVTMPTSIEANWVSTARVVRTGTSAQKYAVEVRVIDSGTNAVSGVFIAQGTLTQTETSTIAIKATGEATSNNDITQTLGFAEFF